MIAILRLFKEDTLVEISLEIPYSIGNEYPRHLTALWAGGLVVDDMASNHSSLYSKIDTILSLIDNGGEINNVDLNKTPGIENWSAYKKNPSTISCIAKVNKDFLDKFAFEEIIDGNDDTLIDLMANNLAHSIADDIIEVL